MTEKAFDPPRAGVVTTHRLKLRSAPSAASLSRGTLPKETVLTVVAEAMNDTTKWYRVRTPAGYSGWVAAQYVALGDAKKEKVPLSFVISEIVKLGWPRHVAYGIAANIEKESSFEPDAVGDGLTAYGLFQWQGARQAKFLEKFGKALRAASPAEQIAFADWELKNTERAAGKALRESRTAYEAGAAFCRLFERPRRDESDERGRRAQEMFDAGGAA